MKLKFLKKSIKIRFQAITQIAFKIINGLYKFSVELDLLSLY